MNFWTLTSFTTKCLILLITQNDSSSRYSLFFKIWKHSNTAVTSAPLIIYPSSNLFCRPCVCTFHGSWAISYHWGMGFWHSATTWRHGKAGILYLNLLGDNWQLQHELLKQLTSLDKGLGSFINVWLIFKKLQCNPTLANRNTHVELVCVSSQTLSILPVMEIVLGW